MDRFYSDAMTAKLLAVKKQTVGKCKHSCFSGYSKEGELCECMVVFRYVKELIVAGIPKAYWILRWQDLEVADAYTALLKKYFAHFDSAVEQALGILYLGANGVGKTAMLCEIGKYAIVRGYGVKYLTAQRYITASMKHKEDKLADYESADILLLDEIDKAYMKEGSDFVPKVIEEFLRRSISEGKLIIAASNEDEKNLSELFGESTLSMIRRFMKIVEVEGEDKADQLQKGWKRALEAKTSYFHPNIIEMAQLKRSYDEDI